MGLIVLYGGSEGEPLRASIGLTEEDAQYLIDAQGEDQIFYYSLRQYPSQQFYLRLHRPSHPTNEKCLGPKPLHSACVEATALSKTRKTKYPFRLEFGPSACHSVRLKVPINSEGDQCRQLDMTPKVGIRATEEYVDLIDIFL